MKWVEMMKKSQHFFDPAAKHREKMINRIYKGLNFVIYIFLQSTQEFCLTREKLTQKRLEAKAEQFAKF